MFAFSTCWNSDAVIDGEPMINEIRALGFKRIELGHGIRISLIEGIQRAIKNDASLKITSLHNFCPLPVGYFRSDPNIYLLSSDRESERQKAIRQTIQTMDFAVKMGARFVVLHLGAVPMGDYSADLLSLIHDGKRDTPKYQKTLEKALIKRKKKGQAPFLKVMKSLEALIQPAHERKMVLGIECRYKLEEIPSENEFAEIFQAFGPGEVGYWHDSGHCQTRHHMGLLDHLQWLREFQGRLVGGHLHDVIYPEQDHQIPGDGTIPFDQLTVLRRKDVLKVFEFEPGTSAEELKKRLPEFMTRFESEVL